MSEELNPITRTEMFLAKAAGQNTPELTPITRVERFLQNLINHIKSIGTGGGGATPDWNAMEGEPGHILNRTHYETSEVILPETVVDFTDTDFGVISPPLEIVEDNLYLVTVNAETSECRLDTSMGMPALLGYSGGKRYAIVPGEYMGGDPTVMVMMWEGEAPPETKISVKEVITVKILEKYLPMASRSYVITLTDEDTEAGAAIAVNSCTYDDFIDILYGGGTVLIKKNPPADAENIYAKFYRPVSWDFINIGDVNSLTVQIYDSLKNVHTTNPNPALMFKGTKTPPTA